MVEHFDGRIELLNCGLNQPEAQRAEILEEPLLATSWDNKPGPKDGSFSFSRPTSSRKTNRAGSTPRIELFFQIGKQKGGLSGVGRAGFH
jgi:hypothetical protein